MRNQLLVIAWMLVIFVSSSVPSEVFPKVEFWGWSKLVHLFYYGVLAYLFRRLLVFRQRFDFLSKYADLLSIVFAVLYGATDEFHQLFTHGRHGQLSDVFIDGFGACLFIVGARIYRHFKPKEADQPLPTTRR